MTFIVQAEEISIMKKYILIVLFAPFSLIVNLNSQNNKLTGNIYISMPDASTYTPRHTLKFSKNKIKLKNFKTDNDTIYSFEIKNDSLIIDGKLNWGKIKYNNDYFELIDKNYFTFQYTKLKPTLITCTQNELNKIIESSFWKVKSGNNNEILHIRNCNTKEKQKMTYRLSKIEDTYIIFLNDSWNFVVRKISKNTIELFGLAKKNNLQKKVDLIRLDI
ncbi:MAG: hypothetical protein CSA39_03060 [Flavobacteriales bacterium]|nr:MAG: hypothetical protein CSA39_03060 [Flavobacteriales bacterium]